MPYSLNFLTQNAQWGHSVPDIVVSPSHFDGTEAIKVRNYINVGHSTVKVKQILRFFLKLSKT